MIAFGINHQHRRKTNMAKLNLPTPDELFAQVLGDKIEVAYNAILTQDPGTIRLKDRAKILAKHEIPVLIIGETGTGKELFAQLLHGNRIGNFVAVNCGGIPDTLIEGEFFGSVKGAFTGAIDKAGFFEQAKDGTLFLDELAELDRSLQSKLLRVIQEKKVRRLGSPQEIKVNCRIVSATNHSVEELRSNNKVFRSDLFYRLAGSIIELAPLRLRDGDAQFIANVMSKTPSDQNFKLPENATWMGNIRELINHIEEYKIFNL